MSLGFEPAASLGLRIILAGWIIIDIEGSIKNWGQSTGSMQKPGAYMVAPRDARKSFCNGF